MLTWSTVSCPQRRIRRHSPSDPAVDCISGWTLLQEPDDFVPFFNHSSFTRPKCLAALGRLFANELGCQSHSQRHCIDPMLPISSYFYFPHSILLFL